MAKSKEKEGGWRQKEACQLTSATAFGKQNCGVSVSAWLGREELSVIK